MGSTEVDRTLTGGGPVGVCAPLRETEEPGAPYWLRTISGAALAAAVQAGGAFRGFLRGVAGGRPIERRRWRALCASSGSLRAPPARGDGPWWLGV